MVLFLTRSNNGRTCSFRSRMPGCSWWWAYDGLHANPWSVCQWRQAETSPGTTLATRWRLFMLFITHTQRCIEKALQNVRQLMKNPSKQYSSCVINNSVHVSVATVKATTNNKIEPIKTFQLFTSGFASPWTMQTSWASWPAILKGNLWIFHV